MWKKWLTGLTVTTILLAGCQKEEEAAEKKVKKKEDEIFTIVVEKSDGIDFQYIEDSLEEKFQMEVEVETVSAKKKRTMLLNGEGDVFLLSPSEVGMAQTEGMIQEVNIEKKRYLDAAVKSFQSDNTQYAIPASFDVPLFVYNPTVIDIEVSSYDDLMKYPIKGETDVEISRDMEEILGVFGEKVNQPYITYLNLLDFNQIDAIAHTYGYEPFVKKQGVFDKKNVQVTSNGMVKAFEKIASLQNGFVPLGELNNKQMIQLYEANLLYSFVMSNKEIDTILTDNKKITALPTIEEGTEFKTPLETKGWVFTKAIDNKEMIKDFEKLITQEEFVRKQINNGFYTPIVMNWEEENERTKAAYIQAQNSYSVPIMAETRVFSMPIERAMEWYLAKKIPLEEALKNAKETIEFEIEVNY